METLVVSGTPLETLKDPGSHRDLLDSLWESFRVSKSPWVYLGVPRTYRDCIIFLVRILVVPRITLDLQGVPWSH